MNAKSRLELLVALVGFAALTAAYGFRDLFSGLYDPIIRSLGG